MQLKKKTLNLNRKIVKFSFKKSKTLLLLNKYKMVWISKKFQLRI